MVFRTAIVIYVAEVTESNMLILIDDRVISTWRCYIRNIAMIMLYWYL